jgi:lipopolysaccharide/colanic/teichoic acid biosynthesis glycosyltransferase
MAWRPVSSRTQYGSDSLLPAGAHGSTTFPFPRMPGASLQAPGRHSAGPASPVLALPCPVLELPPWELAAKRMVDVVGALLLLLVTSPILLVAALLIRLEGPGPVFFIQRRSGRFGREFWMFKLRTMVPDAERFQDRLAESPASGSFLKLEKDPRITRVGRFLRRYSIDEIPQFLNVLKGEMSLVGPRPLLPCDVRTFPRDARARRFDVPPGMTGLWQVSGRSQTGDDERMALDREYVERWNLRLDLTILARTPIAVVTARGAC